MDVITAKSIKEALYKLKQTFIDVVLCDINLGSENGFQFIEELQRNLLDIPFIIISGDVDEKKTERAKKLGAIAIVEKPFNFETLSATIEQSRDPLRRLRDSKARRQARSS
jgi:DNA-binding NtrC family response regulator